MAYRKRKQGRSAGQERSRPDRNSISYAGIQHIIAAVPYRDGMELYDAEHEQAEQK
jgi:hypothetical protein